MQDLITQKFEFIRMIGLHKWLDYTIDWITQLIGLHNWSITQMIDYTNDWNTQMIGLHK
jgi:hypothetical protein